MLYIVGHWWERTCSVAAAGVVRRWIDLSPWRLLWIAWLPFVFVTVVAVLGDALQLPGWVKNIPPMNWVGRVPLENASPAALIGALVAAVALAALTLRAFQDRDIPSP